MQRNCIFMRRMGADYFIEFNQIRVRGMRGDKKSVWWFGADIRVRENDKVNGPVRRAFFVL